jgi:hypothetical protein
VSTTGLEPCCLLPEVASAVSEVQNDTVSYYLAGSLIHNDKETWLYCQRCSWLMESSLWKTKTNYTPCVFLELVVEIVCKVPRAKCSPACVAVLYDEYKRSVARRRILTSEASLHEAVS